MLRWIVSGVVASIAGGIVWILVLAVAHRSYLRGNDGEWEHPSGATVVASIAIALIPGLIVGGTAFGPTVLDSFDNSERDSYDAGLSLFVFDNVTGRSLASAELWLEILEGTHQERYEIFFEMGVDTFLNEPNDESNDEPNVQRGACERLREGAPADPRWRDERNRCR